MTWRYADEAATVLAIDMNGEKIKRAAEAIPPSLRSKLNFVVADMLIGVIEASKSPITEHVS